MADRIEKSSDRFTPSNGLQPVRGHQTASTGQCAPQRTRAEIPAESNSGATGMTAGKDRQQNYRSEDEAYEQVAMLVIQHSRLIKRRGKEKKNRTLFGLLGLEIQIESEDCFLVNMCFMHKLSAPVATMAREKLDQLSKPKNG